MENKKSFQEQLTALREGSRSQMSEEVKSAVLGDIKRLIEDGIVERAPKLGEKLANFILPNQTGITTSLSSLRKKGPVVIMFYRGGWCPYCNIELRAYQEALSQIKAEGATLVAITPELPDESMNTTEKHNLEFDVLTDKGSDYAREIGIMFTVTEEINSIYKMFDLDIEKHNGKGQLDVPLASTFIVDTDGTINYSFVNADYTYRAEPEEIVKKLQWLKKINTAKN